MSKKIAAILAFFLTIQCLGILPLDVNATTTENKIDNDLQVIMETVSEDEVIPVAVWMEDIEHGEIEREADAYRYARITQKIENLPYEESRPFAYRFEETQDFSDLVKEEEARQIIDDYVNYRRNAHTSAYTSENTANLVSLFANETPALNCDSVKELQIVKYVSSYSPVVFMELTAGQIVRISDFAFVVSIFYNPPSEKVCVDEMASAEVATGTSILRETHNLDGTGIKIGMIENGLPVANNNYFSADKIFYDDEFKYDDGTVIGFYYTAHACQVASVLVGKEDGIVPNAELYCTSTKKENGWFSGIEWLLSQGVNVINVSNSLSGYNPDGYGFTSAWLDHIAIQHSVHIIKAAGNINEEHGVTQIPEASLAQNIITVGATDREGELAYYSMYSTLYLKPDICAPGTVYVQYGASMDSYYDDEGMFHERVLSPERDTVHGTSFASPIVAAIVAQFCQKNSTLLVCQDLMKSVLLSGVQDRGIYSVPGTDEINNFCTAMRWEYGAGVVNAGNSYYVVNYGRWVNSSFSATSGVNSNYSRTFTASASDTCIRVALTWLTNVRITDSNTHLVDEISVSSDYLCLKITAPDGTCWTSAFPVGNVQLITFDPRENGGVGTYTIEVIRMTNSSQKVYFGLSWY